MTTAQEGQKKTFAFDAKDLADLAFVASGTRSSEAEAVRRSIRLTAQLLRWLEDDGHVELERDGERRRLVFL